jgi:hypothetical protein
MKPRIFIVESDEGVRELLRTVAETVGGSEIETFESDKRLNCLSFDQR